MSAAAAAAFDRRCTTPRDNTLYNKETGLLQLLDRRIEEYLKRRFGLPEAEIRHLRTSYWQKYGTTLGGLLAEHHVNAQEYLEFIRGRTTPVDVPVEALLKAVEYTAADAALDQLLASVTAAKVIFNSTRKHAGRVLRALGAAAAAGISKPNLQAYQRLLAALGAEAGECLLVQQRLPG